MVIRDVVVANDVAKRTRFLCIYNKRCYSYQRSSLFLYQYFVVGNALIIGNLIFLSFFGYCVQKKLTSNSIEIKFVKVITHKSTLYLIFN